jgi:hypothetical protein
VLNSKLTANYEEALGWLNNSIKMNENYANLNAKARLLAEMGRKDEAITTAGKSYTDRQSGNPAGESCKFSWSGKSSQRVENKEITL